MNPLIAVKTGMMMMGGRAFVDANILLRASHVNLDNHAKAQNLIFQFWDNDIELWISRQILREYLVRATHPNTFHQPLSYEQLRFQFEAIETLYHIADETNAVTSQLKFLIEHYPTRGKQIHDANIVATMLVYSIDTLLTLNVSDMKRFSDRITIATI